MSSFSLQFNSNPWASPLWFIALVPALALTLIPFFRIKRQYRYTRNRVVSLVLRSLVIVFAVLLMSGMTFQITETNKKGQVVIIVDASYTVSNQVASNNIDNFVQKAIEQSGREYDIGVVAFGYDTEVLVPFSRDRDLYDRYKAAKANVDLDTSATNIEAALMTAYNMLEVKSNGRFILLTDALETDGEALAVVSQMASEGIIIDTYKPISSKTDNDVMLFDVSIDQQRISIETPVNITVTAQGAPNAQGVNKSYDIEIRLYDDDTLIPYTGFGNQDGAYLGSLNGTLSITYNNYLFKTGNLHKIRAEITRQRGLADEIEANNVFYSYVDIQGSGAVLLVEGQSGKAGSESDNLKEVLLKHQIDEENITQIRVTDPNMPKTLLELQEFEQIVLMNCSNADLTVIPGFIENLDSYVKNSGGGLLTTGGENAYNETDMNGTQFEKMLPIDAVPSSEPLGLVLIIDKSSSMTNGKFPRLGTEEDLDNPLFPLAKEGAIACINELNPEDYISIVSFSSVAQGSGTNVDLWMEPATNKELAIRTVNGLRTNQGTMYSEALRQASQRLNGPQPTKRQHIIFLTDGNPTEQAENYLRYVRILRTYDVTLSAIGIGGAGADTVEQLALAGGGNHYNVANVDTLPEVMLQEMRNYIPERVNGDKVPMIVTAKPGDSVNALSGVTVDNLPTFGGFYSTRVKPDLDDAGRKKVQLGLTVSAEKDNGQGAMILDQATLGNPLYAEWNYGMGRVGSFTGRLDGGDIWSSGFFAGNGDAELFMSQMVKSLMAKSSPADAWATSKIYPDHETDVNVKYNYKKKIAVRAITGATFRPGDTITAVITDNENNRQTVTLSEGNEGAEGVFTSRTVGVYKIEVTRTSSSGNKDNMITFSTMSYSTEYTDLNTQVAETLMTKIAQAGKGRYLNDANQSFEPGSEDYIQAKDPRLGFAITMVVLFLLDIAARKFKFKWPWEIARDRKAKKEAAEMAATAA